MKKRIAIIMAALIAAAGVLCAALGVFAEPHTLIYWVVVGSTGQKETARYLYCYDMDTCETTRAPFEGYIISGDTSGEGFYYVDNSSHEYSDYELYDFLPFTPKGSTPFNIYRYTQDGPELVAEDMFFDDLYIAVAYNGSELWYLNGYQELIRVDAAGEKTTYPTVYSEWDQYGELYPVTPAGEKLLYINELPGERDDASDMTGLTGVPAIAFQSPDGATTVLQCDTKAEYKEYLCPVYDETNSRIYYFARGVEDDIFTYRLMVYDMATGENAEYTPVNYALSDSTPVALSSDGSWLVANFYNSEFDGIAALSLTGKGLVQIFDRLEFLSAEESLHQLYYSHIGVITSK